MEEYLHGLPERLGDGRTAAIFQKAGDLDCAEESATNGLLCFWHQC